MHLGQWIIRSGTAIALVGRLLFSASIAVAFPQQVWKSLRSNFLSMGAVDRLFNLRNDATSFLSGEILRRAKLASVLAAASWYV
jgi:hypothetical protein